MHDEPALESSGQRQWEPDMSLVKKPVWPPVLGGICIALGTFGLLCGGLGLATLPLSTSMVEGMLDGDPLPPSLSPSVTTITLGLVGLVIAIFLVIAGIVLVMRCAKARVLFLVYACLALPLKFISFLNQLHIQAADKQWALDYPDNTIAQNMSSPGTEIGQMVGLGVFILFGLGWPVFLLMWFGLLKTKPHQITGIPEDEYQDI